MRVLHTFTGEPNAYLGWAVSELADVNHDGVTDLIAGEPNTNDGLAGATWVYSGRSGAVLHHFTGATGDNQGYAVADAGDTNGHRVHDVITGAPNASLTGGPLGKGAVYLFAGHRSQPRWSVFAPPTGVTLGTFFVAGVGDVDGDHVPDVYGADYAGTSLGGLTGRAGLYSGRDGHELHVFTGATAGEGLGPGREAGDVDGDHRPDLAIGSYNSSIGAPSAGRVQLFRADGGVLRTITSTTAGEQLGFDAAGVGDTNHDGIGDLLVSAAEGDTVYPIAGERPRTW